MKETQFFKVGTNNRVIETKGLSKSFGEVQALKSLDLAVPEHAIVGFLGPNGAGKSVTIKLLLGLMKPIAGSGTIFGLDIVRDGPEIRQRVGYLSQSPRFYDAMTAREVLRFSARFFFTASGSDWASPRRRSTIPTCSSSTSRRRRWTRWDAMRC
jgi:ABC-type multidrug transport system ATPase subunit